ncbi:hypothetical protein A9Q02_19225 [Candidatus Chloroploca asiatica]|uniref:Uncharacterized protein n=1 Tax=Candidatus Chloroploca asiatica TaxID=1506545 RepID=A0A2H3KH84_9CHLR|nr:hypothetical protein A9Q02_19225 [Candidatus Chloroploca asiatica]
MTLRAEVYGRSLTPAPRPDAAKRLAGLREPQRWPLRGTPASRAQELALGATQGLQGSTLGLSTRLTLGLTERGTETGSTLTTPSGVEVTHDEAVLHVVASQAPPHANAAPRCPCAGHRGAASTAHSRPSARP